MVWHKLFLYFFFEKMYDFSLKPFIPIDVIKRIFNLIQFLPNKRLFNLHQAQSIMTNTMQHVPGKNTICRM